jgi:hypothetical protein
VTLTISLLPPNGLRYLRWGGDGEAVQPEKGSGVGNCLRLAQNPQRQVHALLGAFFTNSVFRYQYTIFEII